MSHDDPLGKLIIASNNAPLPWGQQQKMVDLFTKFIEDQALAFKTEIERLEKIIAKYEEIKKLKC